MHKFTIQFLFLSVLLSYSAGEPEILDCIRNLDEYEAAGWRALYATRYAEDSSELPGAINGAISGKGIFYADGSRGSYERFYKRTEDMVDIRPAYIYMKYYAHITNATRQRLYSFPVVNVTYWDLPHSPDFTWREALFEVTVSQVVAGTFDANAIAGSDLVAGDFLLVDTIIFAQGENISSISEIKSLCPPEEEPPTTIAPPTNILHCIDTQQDFDLFGWDSYPPHKYAHNSSSLPANLGNLDGQGIFYLDNTPPYPHHVFYKDYSEQFRGGNGPAFIYIKYYAHLSGSNSSAYVQPVQLIPGEYSYVLGSSTGFVWQEKLMEIDTNNSIVGSLVETGVFNIQSGEYLLVDKIIISRGATLSETLRLLTSCL